jgi:hypothetical protein
MKQRIAISISLVLVLAGCANFRVTGTLTNAETGEPAWPCSVTIGSRSAMSNLHGQYKLSAKRRMPGKVLESRRMDVYCKGYERKSIDVDVDDTRYPVVDVQLAPNESRDSDAAASPRGGRR